MMNVHLSQSHTPEPNYRGGSSRNFTNHGSVVIRKNIKPPNYVEQVIHPITLSPTKSRYKKPSKAILFDKTPPHIGIGLGGPKLAEKSARSRQRERMKSQINVMPRSSTI